MLMKVWFTQAELYLFHISVPSFLGDRDTVRSMGHMGPLQHSHMSVHSLIQTCQIHTLKTNTWLYYCSCKYCLH